MNISSVIQVKRNPNIPALSPGDTVRVHVKVVEGERERIQVFQGTVIGVNEGPSGNFIVRRVAYGTGVERMFPLLSPLVDKVEVLRHGRIRRAKLYYLRGLTTKKSRLKEKRDLKGPGETAAETAAVVEVANEVEAPTTPETTATAAENTPQA